MANPTVLRWWPLGGLLVTLGFAPVGLWPLALMGLALWYLGIMQAKSARQAMRGSLLWGMAHGVTALYWLPWAFWHDSNSWLFALGGGIPATLGLALWVALGYGLLALVVWPWRNQPWRFGTLLVVGVVVIETLRNLSPFGFPWLPLGAVWSGNDVTPPLLAQLASVGSVQLLSALVVVMAILIAQLQRTAWLAAALLLAAVAGFGLWRVHQPLPAAGPETIALVQPNQGTQHKWDATLRWRYLDEVLTLSHAVALSPTATQPAASVVVLPETAVPFFLAQTPSAQQALAAALPGPLQVLTGTVRRTDSGLINNFYNSLQVIENGNVNGTYDKHLLVPFGEYLPARAWLNRLPLPAPLRTLSQSRLDFTHGQTTPLLATRAGPVVGLICYEGIFPLFVARHSTGARWLANVTNDAWFTGTSALYQHASLQRLRAIELGLPLVRSANTGISLVVDAYGREVARIEPNTAGGLVVPLPAALASTPWRRLISFFIAPATEPKITPAPL